MTQTAKQVLSEDETQDPMAVPRDDKNLPSNIIPSLLNSIDARHNKIDIYKAIKLRQQGNSLSDIGKIFDCTKQHVQQTLAPYMDHSKQVSKYKKDRANVFADVQQQILKTIDNDAIQKASLLQRVTASGILYDKERLERDKSTANIATLHDDIARLRSLDDSDK